MSDAHHTGPQADAGAPERLAGGTDLMERRRSGLATGPLREIAPTSDNQGIAWQADGSAVLGGLVAIAALAADARLADAYPGLAAAAQGLATPQIRARATVGGNLAQRSRCWYYRNPHLPCLKKGDAVCPARAGNHLYGVIFDRGPCVAPHPSTLGAALLAYAATLTTNQRDAWPVAELFGDGRDGARDSRLAAGEEIVSVRLPPPVAGEQALYRRAIGRAQAEWPLVEVVIRIVAADARVARAWVAVGGVAPVPLRLAAVESVLTGQALDAATIALAAKRAIADANPLPATAYKVVLLEGLVVDMLTALRGLLPPQPS